MMRVSFGATVWSLLALAPGIAAAVELPDSHPSVGVLSKFNFKCPYAEEWVTKGPLQAALDLGLVQNVTTITTSKSGARQQLRRRTQQDMIVAGSCVYTNAWSGQVACLEMRGDAWTGATMESRCASETDSTLTAGAPCAVPGGMTGWCLVGEDGSIEATPMAGDNNCGQTQSACETFMTGTFEAAGDCATESPEAAEGAEGDEGAHSFPYAVPAAGDGPVTCAIAPGAIGAGHQAAYSLGYSPNCEGTPAEGSPYMWPMAWSAHVESKSMEFGSDDVLYHSVGRVHYRLDKNWKRQDWWYQRGVQRNLGTGPCLPENRVDELSEGSVKACRRDSDDYTTMIHRGSKMFFISWKNDTVVGSSDPAQISQCDWLDLQVVGNIRPDWYMDDRGDSTDVQYLGNQHVLHENEPRLVKQWRKKDFANQYFVMSILANPRDDEVHWPMILNVPGEGFGDDFLQVYTNHSMLTDDDDDRFLLDELLEAIGGTCEKMEMGGGAGPPTGETVHIPSNLEVDENSWFSNVYTYSPVWEPPVSDESQSIASGETGIATTEMGNIVVESCYDQADSAVKLSVTFKGIEMTDDNQFPWMALGYRETEECLMNPRDGADTELIMLKSSPTSDLVDAHFGHLPSGARRFDASAVSSISESLVPLTEKKGYSHVNTHIPTPLAISKSETNEIPDADSVTLHFKQSMETVPEAMHLMYAIGASAEVGFHKTRECFELVAFPFCAADEPLPSVESSSSSVEAEATEGNANEPTSATAQLAGVLPALLFVVGSLLLV